MARQGDPLQDASQARSKISAFNTLLKRLHLPASPACLELQLNLKRADMRSANKYGCTAECRLLYYSFGIDLVRGACHLGQCNFENHSRALTTDGVGKHHYIIQKAGKCLLAISCIGCHDHLLESGKRFCTTVACPCVI